ncbi:MAG: transglutaminase-like cysteine peptidase [Beijerinckiaceae bacterium]
MTKTKGVLLGLMAAAVIQGVTSANAAPAGRQMAAYPPLASAAAVKGDTKIPIGWLDFCGRYPRECAGQPGPARQVVLTSDAWRTMVQINARVNAAIQPVTDFEHWGIAERWDYAEDGKGDCEDYVLIKRKALMEAGFPRSSLLVTIVRDEKNEGHAVLTVKTDRGDFVLDNQEEKILPWTATGYRFVKRQSQHDQNAWVSIGDAVSPMTTAAR